MKKCPVCETGLSDPIPSFCTQCGWELKNDLTFGIFLDLPDAVIEEYRQRVGIARNIWNAKAELLRKQAELEEKLRLLEAEMKKKKAPEPAPKPKIPKAADRPAPKPSAPEYSEKTPVPDLKRDPFETPAEFAERMKSHPPVPAGTAELVREEYDIHTGRFPLRVKWAGWIKELSERIAEDDSLHITVERDTARSIYADSPRHSVFVHLRVSGERAAADKAELCVRNRVFPIKGGSLTDIPPGKTWTEPVTGMEFVSVPAGKFMMGDVFGDGYDGEKPVHEVRLNSFYMGKYPVTQGQWKKVMGSNPSHFKKGDSYPVEKVSWDDVNEFIRKLFALNQGKHVFRLPTEAEWEYAARSGGKKEKYAGGDYIDDLAWYDGNSGSETHPVGQKKPNGLGIYDMSGNVWEWCADWYGPYGSGAVSNPSGPSSGSVRVYRGGSWFNVAGNCRSANRNRGGPGGRNGGLGFRVLAVPAAGRLSEP